VSEDPREGKRHVGQPFTPAYNQAVHFRRTRRPAYERQQIKPKPIPIIDEITGPPEFRDPVEESGSWTLAVPPHGRLKGLVAPQPGCGQSEGRESRDGVNHHRQVAPAGHHRKRITQQWIGLTLQYSRWSPLYRYGQGNAGVAGVGYANRIPATRTCLAVPPAHRRTSARQHRRLVRRGNAVGIGLAI
jgi:hypothetical protein